MVQIAPQRERVPEIREKCYGPAAKNEMICFIELWLNIANYDFGIDSIVFHYFGYLCVNFNFNSYI